MRFLLPILALVLSACATTSRDYAAPNAEMLVIAHRGASGSRPEHTLAAYELAIDQGADFIEPDLVMTRDGVLVARHENAISGTTDVADRPEFADRRTTKIIDGTVVDDWFTEDFTLAELKTLRARERLPELRPQNTAYDGQFDVPTLAEILALVARKRAETGRTVGIYPELKHPEYHRALGFEPEQALVDALHGAGYRGSRAPVFIQSFEIGALRRLREMTDLRLVQLIAAEGGPADDPALSYAAMATPAGLARIATYADGIGVDWRLVVDEGSAATPLVEQAHRAGLLVHAWTLRKENAFLPERYRLQGGPGHVGCENKLLLRLALFGVDGVFTDDPDRTLLWVAGLPQALAYYDGTES